MMSRKARESHIKSLTPCQDCGSDTGGKKNKKKKATKSTGDRLTEYLDTHPLDIDEMNNMLAAMGTDIKLTDLNKKKYKFWDTQPVTRFAEKIRHVGVIEPDKEIVRQEPFTLPVDFEWDTIDVENPQELADVYKLLSQNYIEDGDRMFRFDHSTEFLLWALCPPGWKKDWHCGVRVKESKRLVCFISAVPTTIKVCHAIQKMVRVNFLCVHKKMRKKRVAPVLIREITRRANLQGIFQAVYIAGAILPKPITKCMYYHRSLNPRKLVDVKFTCLARKQTMRKLEKLMKLPENPQIKGFREMVPEDIPQCCQLFADYIKTFKLSPVFNEEEFAYYFLTRKEIIHTYVVANEKGEITDMASFFCRPLSITWHWEYDMLYIANSFYTVATKHSLKDLMKDLLISAKKLGYDVFTALDAMGNEAFFEELKFKEGDGHLNYYLYNYRCPDLKPYEIGLVLQ